MRTQSQSLIPRIPPHISSFPRISNPVCDFFLTCSPKFGGTKAIGSPRPISVSYERLEKRWALPIRSTHSRPRLITRVLQARKSDVFRCNLLSYSRRVFSSFTLSPRFGLVELLKGAVGSFAPGSGWEPSWRTRPIV